MPEYLYLCETYNQEFDATHSIKIELEECSYCKEKGLPFDHKPKRLIAGRTSARVELGEQEYRAKIKQDAKDYKREVYQSEEKYANILGPEKYHHIQTQMDKNKGGRW